MTPARRSQTLLAALGAGVLISGIAAVYAKHQSRRLFVELQTLVSARDRLEMDWGRLQIEQSTQGSHARVEKLARDELQMRSPVAGDIELVAR